MTLFYRITKFFLIALIFLFLTVLTQIGGLAFIAAFLVSRHLHFRLKVLTFSILIYVTLTFALVPYIAPFFGREKIKNSKQIKPTTYLTDFLNRNYVNPQINNLLQSTADKLPSNLEIRYLDANFPFLDKFPLLPHLSHNDGKKLDISLMYQTSTGDFTNKKPSRTGYGVFVEPTPLEFNQTEVCKQMGYFQYDFSKYLTLGSTNSDIHFSPHQTKLLINSILTDSNIEKVFIEKHLTRRMNLVDPRIRFQGCRAVRHDDHIHIQVK